MTRPRYRLVALHGFLGSPADWTDLARWFPEAVFDAVDLWALLEPPEVAGWASVPDALGVRLAAAWRDGPDLPAFVIGYSFGARLALAAETLAADTPAAETLAADALAVDVLASPPARVRGHCLVSCHPGLGDEDRASRAVRLAADGAWARRILEAAEDDLWREWDAQPALAGSAAPRARAGLPASRQTLARSLGAFSLATQPDFRGRLRRWGSPLLWVTGANDAKFAGVAAELSAAGVPAEFASCEGAGHRVPWDNPSTFSRVVRGWIDRTLRGPSSR